MLFQELLGANKKMQPIAKKVLKNASSPRDSTCPNAESDVRLAVVAEGVCLGCATAELLVKQIRMQPENI